MLRNTWPLIALAVLGACGTVFGLSAFDWTAWACRQPESEPSKPFGLGPAACLEFWLYRYQTLIGAIAAIGAGYAAWRGAMRQVAMAGIQIDLLRRQVSIDASERLSSKLKHVTQLCYKIAVAVGCDDQIELLLVELRVDALSVSNLTSAGGDRYLDVYNEGFRAIGSSFGRNIQMCGEAIDVIDQLLDEANLKFELHYSARQFLKTAIDKHARNLKLKKLIDYEIHNYQGGKEHMKHAMEKCAGYIEFRTSYPTLRSFSAQQLLEAERARLFAARDKVEAAADGV